MHSSKANLSYRSWLPWASSSLAGLVAVALFLFANLGLLTLYTTLLLSIAIGLMLKRQVERSLRSSTSEHPLDLPFDIAHDEEMFQLYLDMARSLQRISKLPDPVFREAALQKIDAMNAKLKQVAGGTLVFEGTETWRLVYESLLRSPFVHLYRSVAWIKHANYWQDEPGRKSMKLTYELINLQRLNMERIVIIADSLWPTYERFPTESVLRWVDSHNQHGIWIKLVRESTLSSEPQLLADFGIYGTHAVGEQLLDDECKTVRFILQFDVDAVSAAEHRWNRLSVYSVSYKDLLDQPP